MSVRAVVISLLIGFVTGPLFGQAQLQEWEELLQASLYPDNWQVRRQFQEALESPPSRLRNYSVEAVDTGEALFPQVRFEFREVDGAHYISFINSPEFRRDFSIMSTSTSDMLGRGNWNVKRDMSTGEFLQAKIFLLQNDAHSYLRITAGEDRCYLDVFIKGRLLYRHVPVGTGFEQLLYSPMALLLSLTSDSIDWYEIFTHAHYQEWRSVERLASMVNRSLRHFDYVDDGAMDRLGNFVYIDGRSPLPVNGVNCSGFSKWIADGFYGPASNQENGDPWIALDDLVEMPDFVLEEASSWSRNYAERDPLFGLNWVRNLSSMVNQAFFGGERDYYGADLRRVPFFEYREDIGYPLEDLEALLYLAAVKEPGQVFWGVISSPFRPEGQAVTLWQYHHVFVVIPWFNSRGEFHYQIFESGEKATLEQLQQRYGEDVWVHFSTTQGWRSFQPPEL